MSYMKKQRGWRWDTQVEQIWLLGQITLIWGHPSPPHQKLKDHQNLSTSSEFLLIFWKATTTNFNADDKFPYPPRSAKIKCKNLPESRAKNFSIWLALRRKHSPSNEKHSTFNQLEYFFQIKLINLLILWIERALLLAGQEFKSHKRSNS